MPLRDCQKEKYYFGPTNLPELLIIEGLFFVTHVFGFDILYWDPTGKAKENSPEIYFGPYNNTRGEVSVNTQYFLEHLFFFFLYVRIKF